MENIQEERGVVKSATLEVDCVSLHVRVVVFITAILLYLFAWFMPKTAEKIGNYIYKKTQININSVLRYIPWPMRRRLKGFNIKHCHFGWQRRWAYESNIIKLKELNDKDKEILCKSVKGNGDFRVDMIRDRYVPSVLEWEKIIVYNENLTAEKIVSIITLPNSHLERLINRIFNKVECREEWLNVLRVHIRKNGLSASLIEYVLKIYEAYSGYSHSKDIKNSILLMLDEYAAKTMLQKKPAQFEKFCQDAENAISPWVQGQMDETQVRDFILSGRKIAESAVLTFISKRKLEELKVVFEYEDDFRNEYTKAMLAIKADKELYGIYADYVC